MGNVIIGGIVLLALVIAGVTVYKNKKNKTGGCCGDCSGCSAKGGCH